MTIRRGDQLPSLEVSLEGWRWREQCGHQLELSWIQQIMFKIKRHGIGHYYLDRSSMKRKDAINYLTSLRQIGNIPHITPNASYWDSALTQDPLLSQHVSSSPFLHSLIQMSSEPDVIPSTVLKNISERLGQERDAIAEELKDDSPALKIIATAIIEVSLRGLQPNGENNQLDPSPFMDLMETSPRLIKVPVLFQIYLGLAVLQANNHSSQGMADSIQHFPKLSSRIDYLEKNFIQRKDEFSMMRELIRIGSEIVGQMSYGKNSRISEYSLKTEESEISPQKNSPEQDTQDTFFRAMQNFSLVDPKFKGYILDLIVDLTIKTVSRQIVLRHFQVAINILQRRIFEDYDQLIFKALMVIASNQEQKQEMLQDLISCLITANPPEFIVQNKSYLLSLALNDKIKLYLFWVFYTHLLTVKGADKKIFNVLVLWNIELNEIEPQKFIRECFHNKIDLLSSSTESSLHKKESPLAQALLDQVLQYKAQNYASKSLTLLFEEYLGKSSSPYKQYCSMIIHILLGEQFKAECFSGSDLVLKLPAEKMHKVREAARILLKCGQKYQIYDFNFMKSLFLVLSILQIHKHTPFNKSYYSTLASYIEALSDIEKAQMAQYLLKVFQICKNKLSVFVALACILKNVSKELHIPDAAQFLKKLATILRDYEYARIVGFTHESLQLVILIFYWGGEPLAELCLEIISQWALLCSKAELETIIYQFDQKCFGRVKRYLGVGLPNLHPSKFLTTTLLMMKRVLDYCAGQQDYYYGPYNNTLILMPIQENSKRNNLWIKCKVFVNWNVQTPVCIDIYSSSRQSRNSENTRTRVYFAHKSIRVIDRSDQSQKKVLGILKMEKDWDRNGVELELRVADRKMVVTANSTQIANFAFNNLVDNIRFEMKGNVLSQYVRWSRFDRPESAIIPDSTYQIVPSSMEIKIGTTLFLSSLGVSKQLSLTFICSLLRQISKNMAQLVDVGDFYSRTFDIILVKAKTERREPEEGLIRSTFDSILKMGGQKISELPCLSGMQECVVGCEVFYQLLLGSIFNVQFFKRCEQKNHQALINTVSKLLFSKETHEFLTHENQSIDFFVRACQLLCVVQQDVQPVIYNLINNIILTHKPNEWLLKKVSYMFFISETKKCSIFKTNLEDLMNGILCLLMKEGETEVSQRILIAKHIIYHSSDLEIIFLMSSLEAKIKILDFLAHNKNLESKSSCLFRDLPEEDFIELSGWIFCFSKKVMSEYINLQKQTQDTLAELMLSLHLILRLDSISTLPEQKGQILFIIVKFTEFIKNLPAKDDSFLADEARSFLAKEEFMAYLVGLIEKAESEEVKNESINSCIQRFFSTIFKQPKRVLLKCLINFRIISSLKSIKTTLFIFQLDLIFSLSVSNLNCFLQFCLELLVYARQSLTLAQLEIVGNQIRTFLECLIKNYSFVSPIKSPLLYTYPKLQKNIDFKKKDRLKETANEVVGKSFCELKGGIYFKLLSITWNLIEVFAEEDLTSLVDFLLDKICEKKTNKAIYRAVNDFVQVSKDTKERTPIDEAMKSISKEHLAYFHTEDEEFWDKEAELKLVSKRTSIHSENDLTPYFVDYFLMRMCKFLEDCDHDRSEKAKEMKEKYSAMVVKYIKTFEHIFEEMNEKNIQSEICVEELEQMTRLIDESEDNSITEMLYSPSHYRKFSGVFTENMEPLVRGVTFNQDAFLTPSKRARTPSFDLSSGKRRRKELLSTLERDFSAWSQNAKEKKMHRYFRDQTKEITVLYLLHELFVTVTSIEPEIKIPTNKAKKLTQFTQEQERVEERLMQAPKNHKAISDNEMRIVSPYTIDQQPVLKVKTVLFPNMTSPFLQYSKPSFQTIQPTKMGGLQDRNLELNFTQQGEDLDFDFDMCYRVSETENKEEMENFCEISCQEGVYFCEWEFEEERIVFTSRPKKEVKGATNQRIIKYGAPACNIIPEEAKKIQLRVKEIDEVFYRKYNQVQDNSLQFFMKTGQGIFLILHTSKRADAFIRMCEKTFPSSFKRVRLVKDYVKDFQINNYSEKWANGEISNFDYLMLVNKYAGRSLLDLNQYYVFPWVIKDYSSAELNINNSGIYRDLKKPIGALNKKKLEKYLQKVENHSTELGPAYLYGSHYSTSLFILYYLVRLEPFSTLHKQMQGGEFDSPDRLFSSMQQMWDCLMSDSSTSDIKEAIPQFYYLPSFLQNVNNLNLGTKQSGEKVEEVEIPRWADSHVNFIQKMRACLESDYVSAHLNYWIDLIFGRDQRSFQKNNVFYPLAYADSVNIEAIEVDRLEGIMNQITFFGQNPHILFPKEHPSKKLRISMPLDGSVDLRQTSKRDYEQQNLEMKYYVSSFARKNPMQAQLLISEISESGSIQSIHLNFQNSLHSLIRSIQKRDPKLKRALSFNAAASSNICLPGMNLSAEVEDSEATIFLRCKDSKEAIRKIRLKYKFSHVVFDETVLVAYGPNGLRIYDWSCNLVWDYGSDGGSVECCHLEGCLLFFSNSMGKVHVLDMFSNQKSVIFEFSKPTYRLDLMVFCEPRLITKLNQLTFKLAIVGDMRRIVLMSYAHRVGVASKALVL